MTKKSFIKSKQWYEKSRQIIPGGCSTLAKNPSRLIMDYSPLCARSAQGSYFIDVDGNKWLDCEMAMGTIIWGHSCKFINDAIIKQLEKGISFSIAGENEIELAELLLKRFLSYTALKFFKNGADAVGAAIRSARFLSKRNKVLACDYHGWLDWCCYGYYGDSPQHYGIPGNIRETTIYSSNDYISVVDNINIQSDSLACIVICPEKFSPENLKIITDLCHQKDIYVIFDEVSSGIRYGKRGVSGAYEILPDYLCLSKGLTNGLPLAVCMSSQLEILTMEKLKISNAHASENLSIAAAIASEKAIQNVDVWPSWQPTGDKIINLIKQKITLCNLGNNLKLNGNAGNFSFSTCPDFYQDPFRELLIKNFSDECIFTKGFILLSDAHTISEIKMIGEIINNTIEQYAYIC